MMVCKVKRERVGGKQRGCPILKHSMTGGSDPRHFLRIVPSLLDREESTRGRAGAECSMRRMTAPLFRHMEWSTLCRLLGLLIIVSIIFK